MNSKLSARFKNQIRKENLEAIEVVSKEIEQETLEPVKTSFDVEENLKNLLLEKIEATPVWFEYSKERQKELIENFIKNKCSEDFFNIEENEKTLLVENLYNFVSGFGVIEPILNNSNVSAVFVNSVNSVHIEIDGRVLNTEIKLSSSQLNLLIAFIKHIVGKNEKVLHYTTEKYVISLIDEIISIRKVKHFTLEELVYKGFFTKEVFDFIAGAIKSRKNIVISGEVNSGKTILLNLLVKIVLSEIRTAFIGKDIGDFQECSNLMKFEVKNIDYNDLIDDIVKMLPEYIVMDLNSSNTQVFDLLANISTIRATSCDAAFSKLVSELIIREGLPEKFARIQILKNYDYIIQIGKDENGNNKILSISELTPAKTLSASIKTVVQNRNGYYEINI